VTFIWTEALKMLQLGFAAIGFVTFMGIVAFCFEPHMAPGRQRIVRWWRNRSAWGLIGKDDGYGYLPGRERNRVRR
jgi:hypothetical protein